MNLYFETINAILETGHWISDRVSKELKPFDIFEPQYNVLKILEAADCNPISVNTILEQMVQPSSNVTRIVDKLVKKGLVERTLSKIDRRKMDIIITLKGLDLLADLDICVAEFHKQLMNNLSKAEAQTLQQLILKLKG